LKNVKRCFYISDKWIVLFEISVAFNIAFFHLNCGVAVILIIFYRRYHSKHVYVSRLSLTPSDTRTPFKFQRRRFPISVCFSMNINKRQGQSLKQVDIYLQQPVFSHVQLNVAISRVTSRDDLKILLTNDDGDCTSTTSNVVYKEVFQNVWTIVVSPNLLFMLSWFFIYLMDHGCVFSALNKIYFELK